MTLLGALEIGTIVFTNKLPPGPFIGKALYGMSVFAIFTAWGTIFGFIAGLICVSVAGLTDLMTEKRIKKPKWATLIYTGFMTLPIAYLCANIFEGRRASQIPMKSLFTIGLGAVLLLMSYGVVYIIINFKNRLTERRLKDPQVLLGLGFMAMASAAMHVADKKVLPGLYDFFHILLSFASMTAAFLFVYGVYLELKKRGIRFWSVLVKPANVGLIALVSVFLGGMGLMHIGRNNRNRTSAFKKTVMTAKLLRGAQSIRILPEPKELRASVADDIPPPQAPGIRLPNKNIVLLSIDALRADRIGVYGSTRGVTPNIDRIFGKGTRFVRAYTPIPQTSYAITSLLTGGYLVSPERVRKLGRRTTMPEVLHRFNYKSAAFYPPAVFFLDRKFFLDYEKTRLGFGHYVVQYHKTNVDDDAGRRVDAALDVLREWKVISERDNNDDVNDNNKDSNEDINDNNKDNDDDVNDNDKDNDDNVNDNNNDDNSNSNNNIEESVTDSPANDTNDPNDTSESSERSSKFFLWLHFFDPHHPYDRREGYGPKGTSDIARYESEIAYVDAQVGRLHAALKKHNEDTIFVLTADHGEAFGEHGTSTHGTSLYDEQIRVPFLIAGGGVPDKVINAPVDTASIAPTLLSLVDLPLPATMEGNDLTPFMAEAPESGIPPAFSRLAIPDKNLEMASMDKHKLIRDIKHNTLELFDISKDPQERNPLDIDNSRAARKTASKLLGHIKAWNKRLQGKLTTTKEAETDYNRLILSADPEVRRNATKALLSRPLKEELSDTLTKLMNEDPDFEVRHRAAILAARLGIKEAMDPVEKLLERPDVPIEMLHAGAMALANANRKTAVQPLIEVFQHTSEAQPQRKIIKTLGLLKDPAALELLLKTMHTPGIALQSVRAIGDIAHPKGVKPLLERLEIPGTQAILRAEILRTLGKIGTPAALQRVRIAIEQDQNQDPLVTAAALSVMSLRENFDLTPPGWKKLNRRQLSQQWPADCKLGEACTPTQKKTLKAVSPKLPRTGDDLHLQIWIVSRGKTSSEIEITPTVPIQGMEYERKQFYDGAVVLLTVPVKQKDTTTDVSLRFAKWPEEMNLQCIMLRTKSNKQEQ